MVTLCMSARLLRILAIALLLFVGWDFAQRLMLTVRLRQAEEMYDRQIVSAQTTRTALIDQKNLAQTDAFIEAKVRREKHYVRDGETLVIVQATPVAPRPPAPLTVPAPSDNWLQTLFNVFFAP